MTDIKNENKIINSTVAHRLTVRDLALSALFAAVMAVCSWISVPAEVPFTMQTFAVFLAVGVLGGKRGTLSVLAYLLIGLAGAPVFSGFTGGPARLLGPTGGYIAGFLVAALIMWALESITGRSMPALFAQMLIGLAVCYLFGTLWFVVVYTRQTEAISFAAALSMCVLPFIIPDCIKIFLACVLTRRLRPRLAETDMAHRSKA